MEEKFMMSLHKPLVVQGNACCSPDTDKTGMLILLLFYDYH